MDSSPNYNNYTLEELLDVKNHIDREHYPDRAKEIDLLISHKIQIPGIKEEIEAQQVIYKYSTFWPRFWAATIDGILFESHSLRFHAALFVKNKEGEYSDKL